MNYSLAAIDPFYAACLSMSASTAHPEPSKPFYAKLPQAPKNASPVPHLTSLYHAADEAKYGDRSYPGNCGGNLIKDLLLFFRPTFVLDPMSGSGTCPDVCDELGIPCMAWDIHQGIDACDPEGFSAELVDFIWVHPPYWRMKLYSDDPRDMSRAPSLEEFLRRYRCFLRNCTQALKPGGKLAILMGDYIDREVGFIPLTWHTKRLAFESGLSQACTDIIRFLHGTSSSKKVYSGKIIPTLHDVCCVFEK